MTLDTYSSAYKVYVDDQEVLVMSCEPMSKIVEAIEQRAGVVRSVDNVAPYSGCIFYEGKMYPRIDQLIEEKVEEALRRANLQTTTLATVKGA